LDNGASDHQEINSQFACGIHPRNWCDNIETARRCNVIDNCISQWSYSNIIYKQKKDETSDELEIMLEQKKCGFCQFIYGKLENQNSADSKLDAKDYLRRSCNLMPSQSDVEECLKSLELNYASIEKMLSKSVDKSVICKVLGSCQMKYLQAEQKVQHKQSVWDKVEIELIDNKDSSIVRKPLTTQQTQQYHSLSLKGWQLVTQLESLNGIACETCQIVFNTAKYLIENKVNQQEIISFVQKELCARLGDYKMTCDDYLIKEGSELIELIVRAVNSGVLCKDMGFCRRNQLSLDNDEPQFYDLKSRTALNCTVCESVMDKVKSYISDKTSQATILGYIKAELCSRVESSAALCRQLVDQYGPLFLAAFAQDIKSDQICDMIGMCPKGGQIQQQLPHVHLTQQDNTANHLISIEKDDAGCILCEFALSKLKDFIGKNSTEVIKKKKKELSLNCGFENVENSFLYRIILKICFSSTNSKYKSTVQR
jgi:hypothetical protein